MKSDVYQMVLHLLYSICSEMITVIAIVQHFLTSLYYLNKGFNIPKVDFFTNVDIHFIIN